MPLAITLRNTMLLLLYKVGVSRDSLPNSRYALFFSLDSQDFIGASQKKKDHLAMDA